MRCITALEHTESIFHPFSAWTFFLLVMPCFVEVLLTLFRYRASCRWLPFSLCTAHSVLQTGHLAWEHPSPTQPFSVENGACAFQRFPILTTGTGPSVSSSLVSSSPMYLPYQVRATFLLNSMSFCCYSHFSLSFILSSTFSCSMIQSLFHGRRVSSILVYYIEACVTGSISRHASDLKKGSRE